MRFSEMAALRVSSVLFLWMFPSFIAAEDPVLAARPGDSVTLPCRGPPSPPVALLDWSRPELQQDGYVFFYRDGKVYESYQHQIYRGRVQLLDSEITDGDVSVILKNVSVGDSGTFQCVMFLDTGPGQKPQLRHSVRLQVTEATEVKAETPNVPGNLALNVRVSAAGVLLVSVPLCLLDLL